MTPRTGRPLFLALLVAAFALLGAVPLPPPTVVVYPLTVGSGADPESGANLAVLLSTKLSQLGGVTVRPYPAGVERAKFLDAARAADADYYVTGFLTPLGDDVSLILQVVSTHSGSVVFSTTALVRTYADAAAQADVLRQAIIRHAGRSFASLDQPAPTSETPAPSRSERNEANLTRVLPHRRRNAPSPSPSPSASPAAAGAPGAAATATAPSPSPSPNATRAPRTRGRRSPPSPSPSPSSVPSGTPATAAPNVPVPPAASPSPDPRSAGSNGAATRTPGAPRVAAPAASAAPAGSSTARGAATPLPASPTPRGGRRVAALPTRSFVVATGAGGDDALHAASDALVSALGRDGVGAASLAPGEAGTIIARAPDVCAKNPRVDRLYVATLSLRRDDAGSPNSVDLNVAAYDCTGSVIGREHAAAGVSADESLDVAVTRAAQGAIDALVRAHP